MWDDNIVRVCMSAKFQMILVTHCQYAGLGKAPEYGGVSLTKGAPLGSAGGGVPNVKSVWVVVWVLNTLPRLSFMMTD